MFIKTLCPYCAQTHYSEVRFRLQENTSINGNSTYSLEAVEVIESIKEEELISIVSDFIQKNKISDTILEKALVRCLGIPFSNITEIKEQIKTKKKSN